VQISTREQLTELSKLITAAYAEAHKVDFTPDAEEVYRKTGGRPVVSPIFGEHAVENCTKIYSRLPETVLIADQFSFELFVAHENYLKALKDISDRNGVGGKLGWGALLWFSGILNPWNMLPGAKGLWDGFKASFRETEELMDARNKRQKSAGAILDNYLLTRQGDIYVLKRGKWLSNSGARKFETKNDDAILTDVGPDYPSLEEFRARL
jgi:hypothetical protein